MKKEINIYTKSVKSFDEVDLFKELQRHLQINYKSIFIDRTHQQYVNFKSLSTGCVIKRELSDLWIIAYSPKRKEAKMTFLQAKLDTKKYKPGLFSFTGDFFQLDLLAKRPRIKDISKFNFPDNILSGAVSDSVGSFGIFYYDDKKEIDFAFSTASDISYIKNGDCSTLNRKMKFINTSIEEIGLQIKMHNIELRNTLQADCFEQSLLKLYIGTPIQDDKSVIIFLKNYFLGLSQKPILGQNPVINDFLKFLDNIGDNFRGNFKKDSEGNPNILLINVDKED